MTAANRLFVDTEPNTTAESIYDAIKEARKQPRYSDLHLNAGERPRARLDGDIVEAGSAPVTVTGINDFLTRIAIDAKHEKESLSILGRYVLVHTHPEIGRIRVTVSKSESKDVVAIRLLADEPPELEDLSLPPVFNRIAENNRGLAILAGPTGAGKTTALAAVIRRINQDKSKKIELIEEWPEYLHKSKRSIVNPILIGRDAPTYETALDTTLIDDADIVIVAEARTPEALYAALLAADLGKRVIMTVHIDSVTRFADRIIGAFPPEKQNLVRMMLASQTQEVVYMQLPKRIQPTETFGRIPACEILTRRDGLLSAIADVDGKNSVSTDAALKKYIESGKQDGDILLEDALHELVAGKRLIDVETAMSVAIRQKEMAEKLKITTAGKAGSW